MAFYSLHAYDADLFIPGFLGIDQTGEGINGDVRFASEEKNLETIAGTLQPQAAPVILPETFQNRVETLAWFHRRWYEGEGSKDWLVACAGGKLYSKQEGHNAWLELELPSGTSAFESSEWSCATYEINPVGSTSSIDVLLMSNATDGMIMVVPPERPTTHEDLESFTHSALHSKTHTQVGSPAWHVTRITTAGYKFGVIERYAERIWGGAIEDEPDLLVYSRPYDPTDWTPAGTGEEPEDGAGEVRQPSWDGKSFTALRAFGNQLLAFKQNRVWRVMGTDPGEYTFKEQYGGGAPYYKTIAVETERVLMVEKDGLAMYDGLSATPMNREKVEDIWKTVNKAAMDQMVAALYKQKYYLAFPTGSSTVNNAMLIFNLQEGTILYYDGIYIESFMATEENLYATSSTLPGKILRIVWDSWDSGEASGKATRWVSPWLTFDRKSMQKGGFDVYFQPEVKDTAVTLKFSIQTEKKLKTKTYTVNPLTEEQLARNKGQKTKRLHISGMGRRFRLIVETEAGVTAPWRLLDGIQMIVETDPD